MKGIRSMQNTQPHRHSQGFTLIELIMVLVMVSVLSAYAAARWSPGDSAVHAEAAHLARDLRHAQSLAMTSGEHLTFDLLGSGSYQVTGTSGVITDPSSGENFAWTFASGVSRSGSCGDIEFDTLGRPVVSGALLASTCSYVLSGDSISATVTLIPVTGFVTVNP